MDETAIGRCFPGLRGTIVNTASKLGSPSEHASLSQRRSYMSYLACVADDRTVQAKLPQVLLGNKHQFTLNFLRSIAGKLPPNIELWRQTSSWNSHSTMRKWLSLLAKSLGSSLRRGMSCSFLTFIRRTFTIPFFSMQGAVASG